jgi:hypothetical protein
MFSGNYRMFFLRFFSCPPFVSSLQYCCTAGTPGNTTPCGPGVRFSVTHRVGWLSGDGTFPETPEAAMRRAL